MPRSDARDDAAELAETAAGRGRARRSPAGRTGGPTSRPASRPASSSSATIRPSSPSWTSPRTRLAAVVLVGAVGIEPDQAGQAAFAAVHLADDLLVVDPFEELPRERARRPASQRLSTWSRKLSAMSCSPFSISLSWILRCRLISSGGLELGGKPGLELAEAHVVEARGVDVVAGDASVRVATQLDRAIDRPVRVLRVVDGDEDLAIHRHLGRWSGVGHTPFSRRAPDELGPGQRSTAVCSVATTVRRRMSLRCVFARREYAPGRAPVKARPGLSGDDLIPGFVPNSDRVYRAESHARSNRSRSTRSGSTKTAIASSSSLKASGASVTQSPKPTHS